MDLSGKVAIVTGSGQGLGLAYAKALADAGAAVVINDVAEDRAEKAAAEIAESGGRAITVPVAVGTTEAAQTLVDQAVDAFGRLDAIITNAGILRDKVLWNMSDDDFDAVIHVHLRGTFTCVREAVKHFRRAGHGGRVVLTGSPAGQRGNFGQTNYAAAKAGIAAMARTWAMECAKAGVTVNAIVPNAATAMTETIPFLAPYVEGMKNGEPIPSVVRRAASFGTPEDVAGLVVFLASDDSAGITGQCIGIGGDRLSLWSHPTEIRSAFLDGGWTADAIADDTKEAGMSELASESTAQRLDLDNLIAIDVHTHAETDGCGHYSLPDDLRVGADRYFGAESGPPNLDEMADYYRQRRMAAVVFTVDAESALGHRRLSNDDIAVAAAKHPDVLIPFASIDPAKGLAGVREARRLVTDHGVRGFKFHPSLQAFWPNDRGVYPLYEAISELGSSTPTRCCSTTLRSISQTSPSSLPTPRSRGRTKRSPWRRTNPRCT